MGQGDNPGDADAEGQYLPAQPRCAGARRKYFRDYGEWLRPYRLGLAIVFFLALTVAALDLIWPLAIKMAIDDVLTPATRTGRVQYWVFHLFGRGYRLEPLLAISVGILILLVVKQSLDALRGYELAVLNAKMVFRLRRKLFERLLGLSLGEISEMKSGGVVARLSGDVENVNGLLQAALIGPCVAAVRVIVTVIIFLILSWRLAFSALVLLPPLVPLTYIWLKRVRPIYRSVQADKAVVDGRVVETFGGIRVVRSFRREPREEHAYAVGNHTIIRKLLRAAKFELLLEAGWGLLVPASTLLIIWYGGWLVLNHEAQMGDLFAFQIYSVLLLPPVFQVILAFSQTQKGLASMERVFDALRLSPDKPDAPDAQNAPAIVREMRLENVWFAYRPGLAVLKDISLVVPGGCTVALVGPSGAGKSTLTDLIARFHDPSAGGIYLNGIDLRKLRLASFRSLLAVVPQDVFLFDGSIAQNIAYGRRGACREEIIDAARRANAHDFIVSLPEGYDTLIG
ncbi:MAG TPA: ABC transporter ATP-binding protein, partial [Tepidisphaeraceae bacterium]|nr:ABC transporter ATP-binding protein [Tepidisphaeraceae bacterium]